MLRRFNQVGTHANLCMFTKNNPNYPNHLGCFSNHLAMMDYFYHHTDKPYGIFAEDDIFLKTSLTSDLENVCHLIPTLKVDILLLGYLIDRCPEDYGCIKNKSIEGYHFYMYQPELWSTIMYVLTRKQVKYYLDYFTPEYVAGEPKEVISADWTFTKMGSRALLYPPLAVEEGQVNNDHYGQVQFHKQCREFLYNHQYTD